MRADTFDQQRHHQVDRAGQTTITFVSFNHSSCNRHGL
jgi:hypothetical protein